MAEQSSMQVEGGRDSSEGEWEFEVEGYEEADEKVERSLLVFVRQRNLSMVGKSFVLLRILESLRGYSPTVKLSVQDGTLPRVDSVEAESCWLVRASDSDGTDVLRRQVGKAMAVPSANVPDYPPGGRAEISVEFGGMVSGGEGAEALLGGAAALPSFAELGLGLFSGAAILGTGIVRGVQGMPWTKGPMDLCAAVVEKSLGERALLCGYTFELLPCTDPGSAHFGRKLERAAPAGKRPTDQVDAAYGAKFRFKAKPKGAAAGAALGAVMPPLVLPSLVRFPAGGVGRLSAAAGDAGGKKVKVTLSSTEVDVYYCDSAGVQVRSRVVASGWNLPCGSSARHMRPSCPCDGPAVLCQVSAVRSGGVAASVFHPVGTCATAGLDEGWEVGRVAAARVRVRVDPGKLAAAERAVRAASGSSRMFYDGALCSRFVGRLGKALQKQRDPARRSVRERAGEGLAAVSKGAVEGGDCAPCLKAACRSECELYPCINVRVLRARSAQGALSELGGKGVTVGGATVAMPSGGASSTGGGRGGGRSAGGPAPRRAGKSSRDERDGYGDEEIDYSCVPPGMSEAECRAAAVAAVNTRAAVAKASAQVNGFLQQGWDHMSKAEAGEVTAALGAAIEGGELPMDVVHSVKDLQLAMSTRLRAARSTEEGRVREISVLRANRCNVLDVKLRADVVASKRAKKTREGNSSANDSEAATGYVLTAPDKQSLWEDFLDKAHGVYSKAVVFGELSSAEVTKLCTELQDESLVDGDVEKYEEVVRAGLSQLVTADCVTVGREVGGQSSPSYTFKVQAFFATSSGQAVKESP